MSISNFQTHFLKDTKLVRNNGSTFVLAVLEHDELFSRKNKSIIVNHKNRLWWFGCNLYCLYELVRYYTVHYTDIQKCNTVQYAHLHRLYKYTILNLKFDSEAF